MMPRKSLFCTLTAALLVSAWPAQAQQAEDYPGGPGKETFVATCGGCHDLNRSRAGYTPAGWNTVVNMMQNMDTPVPPEQWPTLAAYLMKSFPERQRPAAAAVEGPVQAAIKMWAVPTRGSRPHDPLATKDGAIWWTGQLANKLGRLDPKTGLIGKLDPNTGLVTEYKLPDPAAKDPHTLIFDHDGILWFTVQQANRVGRLDPRTGEIKLVTSPTARSRPYGMAVNSKNVVFFVEFGANKVASIDSRTMEIKEYPLPDARARPRRIVISPDDVIWYTDFARGFLGRLDIATGKITEWQSPSGPKSEPYGVVFAQGALWYNESFAKPNTIVRFDPKTEKFQTWQIPGGGDIVRNMDVTPDGNPVMANSLANEVGMVEIK